jgi:small-conductance mechanosensitive channel
MMDWQKFFEDHEVLTKILSTVAFLLVAAGTHFILLRAIQRRGRVPKRTRRRWIVNVRNALVVMFLFGAAVIWFKELRTLAAGIMVIGVAFVLATKEIWLNISGFLFRTGTHFFAVGDRIEVGDFRGDVIDQRLSGATIFEIGPGTKGHQYTGRAVFIPNSKFLSLPVIKETAMRGYVFHLVTIPLKTDCDWSKREEALLQAASQVCSAYIEKVRKAMQEVEQRHSLDAPAADPKVHIQLPEPGRINLALRLPVPVRRRGRIEQDILRAYLGYLKPIEEQEKAEAEAKKKAEKEKEKEAENEESGESTEPPEMIKTRSNSAAS